MATPTNIITTLQENILALINEVVPDLRESEIHPGNFSREDISRFRKRAPAALVSCLRLSNPELLGGVVKMKATTAVLICAKSGKGLSSSAAALNILTAILGRLPNAVMSEYIYPAENIEARDFTLREDSRHTESIWVLNFENAVYLPPIAEDEVLPKAAYLGFAPDIGAGQVDNYKLIAGSDDA